MVYEPNWSRLKQPKINTKPTEPEKPETAPKLPRPAPDAALEAQKARVYGIIQAMRNRGLSYQQIATILQGRDIPRPGGALWSGKAIASICQTIARKAQRNQAGQERVEN